MAEWLPLVRFISAKGPPAGQAGTSSRTRPLAVSAIALGIGPTLCFQLLARTAPTQGACGEGPKKRYLFDSPVAAGPV